MRTLLFQHSSDVIKLVCSIFDDVSYTINEKVSSEKIDYQCNHARLLNLVIINLLNLNIFHGLDHS